MINILLTEKCNAQRAQKITVQLKLLQLLPNVTIHFLQSGYDLHWYLSLHLQIDCSFFQISIFSCNTRIRILHRI